MTGSNTALSSETPRTRCLLVLLLVAAACLACSVVRAPIPAVNEPHYLAKARHFVDPDWCPGDFFLSSANPHLVFYSLVGPLTHVIPFSTVAWIGRVLSLLLLASGWVALVTRLVPGRWAAWHATCLFLLMAAAGNLSGEWVVGGFESKVFAYGFLLWSAASAIDGRRRAGIFCGLAICFHPIVGGWGFAAAILARLASILPRSRVDNLAAATPQASRHHRFTGVALLLLCAAPGLIPALGMLGQASPEADAVQVFSRLGHHLVPSRFSPIAVAGYAGLFVAWWIARRRLAPTGAERWWTRLVLATLAIALVGLVVSLRQPSIATPLDRFRLTLMKFYPFRLFDVMLPAAAAITAAGLLAGRKASRVREALPISALILALLLPALDRNPSRQTREMQSDWQATCQWIRTNLPADVIVLTPGDSWAFKWYAQRAEYVVFKDCPQDANGILEWRRRQQAQARWLSDIRQGHSPDAALDRWVGTGQVSHVLWNRSRAPTNLTGLVPLYTNATFAVYQAGPGP